MSGIAGIYHRGGRPVSDEPDKMLAALAHRGPDGLQHWRCGAVGLGHAMLRTTPEAAQEMLPLVQGELVLTADARIDNRDELIRRLGLTDRPASQLADSALILAAYEKWGTACPEYLVGDFAFALWDGHRQTLFCARDHMGVRPFYYHCSPTSFACASEIKALLALPGIPQRANDARIADFLLLLESAGKDETAYAEIWRLPPGHRLEVSPAGLTIRRYWALDPEPTLLLGSDAAYAEAFREVFAEAVRCRLRTTHAVGSILSGGLDSACVTVMARELWQRPTPLHTYSAVFTGSGDTDERPFIDAILTGGGLLGHRIDGNDLQLSADEVGQIARQVEEPIWYAFQLVLWRLYGLAHTQGVRVLIDGVDGDAVVASVRQAYLADLLRAGAWRTFVAEVDGAARRRYHGSPVRYLRHWLGQLKRHFAEPLLAAPVREGWQRFRGTTEPLPAYIAQAFAQRMDLRARRARRPSLYTDPGLTARQVHYRWLTGTAFPYHLEMLNRAAAAFGLEYRHPFFDRRLVEFSLALPAGQKYSRGETRAVMRRALADLLPASIYHRPDKGAVHHHYLRSALTGGAPSWGERMQADPGDAVTYLDPATMAGLWTGYLGNKGAGSVNDLWYSMSMYLWLHQMSERNAQR